MICQMAKHHFDVPRTIARVNNPKNERLFRHLGVDEIISPTRMILGSIEQDIPVHELLHLAALGEGELEIIEAHLQPGSPAIGRVALDLTCPRAARCSASSATASRSPVRADTVLARATRSSRSAARLRGRAARAADRRPGQDVAAGRPDASIRARHDHQDLPRQPPRGARLRLPRLGALDRDPRVRLVRRLPKSWSAPPAEGRIRS